MPNFYFDGLGSCKDPGQAIAYLQADQYSPPYLSQLYPPNQVPQGTIHLGTSALLMMGTTGELQTALRQDYLNGIRAVETAGIASMRIMYVRRRAGLETKTVVIIASWTDYWGQNYNWFGGNNWYDLHQGYYNAQSLQALADQLLPTASGGQAWW
jgi:hypothetical protein